jgi:hypothetical protein
MAKNKAITIFAAYNASGTSVMQIEIRYSGTAYQLRAGLVTDGGSLTNTSLYTISDASHVIEIDWRASSAPGANNGGLSLWIDEVQQTGISNADNDTRRIESVRLGGVAVDNRITGNYYIDAFASRRQSYIGR